MDSPFMEEMARGVAGRGIRVVRFEFPYMAQRRDGGAKKPPNAARVLEQCWREVLEITGARERTVIGGKSMGGRIASQIADEAEVLGLCCLGYPFHPPGRPERLRTEHLRELRTPALFVQGERDPFGTRDEVASYELSAAIEMAWLPDGEHSFRPRVRSGHTAEENMARAVQLVADFVLRL
jgi:predicted alpha/beta-hydrolase family hydrolase